LVAEALHKAKRDDLIGYGKECLIKPVGAQKRSGGSYGKLSQESKQRKNSGRDSKGKGGKKPRTGVKGKR
ncbi:MAG: hypothetical protein U0M06_13640, partial [Clostridia bacterium]|nr:hypothetical protein [Clostridia bacterium]